MGQRSKVLVGEATHRVAHSAAAASPRTSGRHADIPAFKPTLFLRWYIRDAVDRSVVLVGYQQRAVRHLQHIGRPAEELVLLLVEQSGHERLQRRLVAVGAG